MAGVVLAALDLFLWIGPRLGFRPLIESLAAQLPAQGLPLDMGAMLDLYAARLNHFSYLSVSLMGVPALMSGLTPEKTPIQPLVIERAGWGEWGGYLALFTLGGLLLAALYYSLIAYALRRMGRDGGGNRHASPAPDSPDRPDMVSLAWAGVAVSGLRGCRHFPGSAYFRIVALINQTMATFVLMGAMVFIVWLIMFFSYTPQGMALNPAGFVQTIVESVRLFRANLPASLGLRSVVTWPGGCWISSCCRSIPAHG